VTTSRPFQRLDDRLAGRSIDDALFKDVPAWLDEPLRPWLALQLRSDTEAGLRLAERVVLRLQLEPHSTVYGPLSDTERIVDSMGREDRLIAVDAVVQLHSGWDLDPAGQRRWAHQLVRLGSILRDGSSAYRVDAKARCLVRRVDATVELAAQETITAAPSAAADHLRQAWSAAFGLTPDPDKAFQEAIRAVEELACPLVENRRAERNKATMGTVLGELRGNARDKWEVLLPGDDGQPRDVGRLIGMMELLWEAQVSRHGGGTKSRRQLQPEAEAAVPLAVLLVQWLSAGVLRRKA
jgi:hypothetical protein